MKTRTKRILLVVVAVPVLALAIVVWEVFQALHTFGVEDQIHGTFFPVSRAIEQYTDTHGAPPKTLEQLIPAFLVSIPASPYAYKNEKEKLLKQFHNIAVFKE